MKSLFDLYEIVENPENLKFIKARPTGDSRYYVSSNVSLYARIGAKFMHTKGESGAWVTFVTVANIQVDENMRGRGILTRILDILEDSPYLSVFVENVHQPEMLGKYLEEKRGYTAYANGYESYEMSIDIVRSYYKLLPDVVLYNLVNGRLVEK